MCDSLKNGIYYLQKMYLVQILNLTNRAIEHLILYNLQVVNKYSKKEQKKNNIFFCLFNQHVGKYIAPI